MYLNSFIWDSKVKIEIEVCEKNKISEGDLSSGQASVACPK